MPQPFERDFGMYIGDKPSVIPPTPTPTPEAAPVAPASEASPATADLEKLQKPVQQVLLLALVLELEVYTRLITDIHTKISLKWLWHF